MNSEDLDEGIPRKRKLNLLDFLKDESETPAKRSSAMSSVDTAVNKEANEPFDEESMDYEPGRVRPFGELGAKYSDEEDEEEEDYGDNNNYNNNKYDNNQDYDGARLKKPSFGRRFTPLSFAPAMSFQKGTQEETEPLQQLPSKEQDSTLDDGSHSQDAKSSAKAVLSTSEVETLSSLQSPQQGSLDPNKGKKYGIGASLLKKMGYIEGQGLGKHGQGILEPIEQELRRAGVGIGAGDGTSRKKTVRKKHHEDKDQNEDSESENDSDDGRYDKAPVIEKNIYQLIIELESKGVLVPKQLKTYSDGHLKQSHRPNTVAHNIIEHDGTIQQVRTQLSILNQEIDEINSLTKLYHHQTNELIKSKRETSSMLSAYEELSTVIDSLSELFIDSGLDISAKSAKLRDEIGKLESVNSEDTEIDIQKTIIIAIKPIVTDLINEWDPLDFSNDTTLEELILLKNVLPDDTNELHADELDYFQSLLYSLWYPKVHDALLDWSIEQPNVAITLLLDWNEVLDKSIIDHATDTIIKPKILKAIQNWDPATTTSNDAPFVWIFEYMPYLEESMDEIKEEFIQAYTPILEKWPQSDTHIEGLRSFKEIIGFESFDNLINKKLIPNLTRYLFNSEKSFQHPDVSIIESFFIWERIISKHIFDTLLQYAFFESWKESLYQELRSKESSFEIISQSFEKWVDCLRCHSQHSEVIITEVYQALSMINKYIDTGELIPVHAKALTIDKILYTALNKKKGSNDEANKTNTEKIQGIPTHKLQVTFKDVVEHYCTGNNLFITPLKNDLSTGHSLFKIVGNNVGKNGLTAYIEEDVLWIKSSLGKFEPVSLGDLLTRF